MILCYPSFKENFVLTNSKYVALVSLLTAIPVESYSVCNVDISVLYLD